MGLKFISGQKINRPVSGSFEASRNREPIGLATQVFALKEGDTTEAYKREDGAFIIAQLKKIKSTSGNSSKDKEQIRQLQDDLKREFSNDILTQYNIYLRGKYPVEMKNSAL